MYKLNCVLQFFIAYVISIITLPFKATIQLLSMPYCKIPSYICAYTYMIAIRGILAVMQTNRIFGHIKRKKSYQLT